ncbi:MAG: GntR family transcriptional regulator [Deinococcales bacterium]
MAPRAPLPTLSRTTLDEGVYRALRQAILGGGYEDGERLIQEDIAQSMGTSRVPVRDALKRLLGDGLVSIDARGRYYVSTFSSEDTEEVYGLRALLEPYAARLGAERIGPQALRELEGLVDELSDAARRHEADRYVELNRAFHMSLYEASGQGRLMRIIESLWSGTPPTTPITLEGQMAQSAREHRKILAAIQARDGSRVEQRMKTHIERTAEAFKSHLRRA